MGGIIRRHYVLGARSPFLTKGKETSDHRLSLTWTLPLIICALDAQFESWIECPELDLAYQVRNIGALPSYALMDIPLLPIPVLLSSDSVFS